MNRAGVDADITSQPAPALRPGQIVVTDNLSSHKSGQALKLLRAQGNDQIFRPPCSPDLNPIKMAFSQLKTLIRNAAAKTCQALCKQVGDVCDLFLPTEYRDHFIAAGHGSN